MQKFWGYVLESSCVNNIHGGCNFFTHPTLYSNKVRKLNRDFSNVYLARIKLLKGILTNNYGTTTNSFELYTNFHEEASYRVFAPDHLR